MYTFIKITDNQSQYSIKQCVCMIQHSLRVLVSAMACPQYIIGCEKNSYAYNYAYKYGVTQSAELTRTIYCVIDKEVNDEFTCYFIS